LAFFCPFPALGPTRKASLEFSGSGMDLFWVMS
jgi:hypothetical protein